MDFSLFLAAAAALFYIGFLVFIANQEDSKRTAGIQTERLAFQWSVLMRWMLFGVIAVTFLYSLLLLQVVLFSGIAISVGESPPHVSSVAAGAAFALGAAVSLICWWLVMSARARALLARFTGPHSRYDPESSVHLVAVVLCLALLSLNIGQLVLGGGLEGLAQSLESGGLAVADLIFQGVVFVALAFLGVGFALRRTLPQSLERLGLRLPTSGDVVWGFGGGLLLYGALVGVVVIWTVFAPADRIAGDSAAAERFAALFDTLPLAFVMALTAAVSEEILFRGALQPVFGLWPTSLFFALVHIQYTLTPATLVIFGVSLGLGWLRQRQSTTAAIFAHFVFNFIQVALPILFTGGGT